MTADEARSRSERVRERDRLRRLSYTRAGSFDPQILRRLAALELELGSAPGSAPASVPDAAPDTAPDTPPNTPPSPEVAAVAERTDDGTPREPRRVWRARVIVATVVLVGIAVVGVAVGAGVAVVAMKQSEIAQPVPSPSASAAANRESSEAGFGEQLPDIRAAFDRAQRRSDLPAISPGYGFDERSFRRIEGLLTSAQFVMADLYIARNTAQRLCLVAVDDGRAMSQCVKDLEIPASGLTLTWATSSTQVSVQWSLRGVDGYLKDGEGWSTG